MAERLNNQRQQQQVSARVTQQNRYDHQNHRQDHGHDECCWNEFADILAGISGKIGNHQQPNADNIKGNENVGMAVSSIPSSVKYSGKSTINAPAGAGTPTKKSAFQAGLFGSSSWTLKRARRRHAQMALIKAPDAGKRPYAAQQGKIQNHGRRNAKIDKICQAVHLCAKFSA